MDYEAEQIANNLKPGEKLVTTHQKKKVDKKPSYIIVGNGVATKAFPAAVTMDAFRVFSSLTKEQQGLFIDLKDIYVQQNLDNYQKQRTVENPNKIVLDKNKDNELHQSIKARMGNRRNCTTLEEKGVLKKIKTGIYMLNPYLFIPSDDFKQIAEIWADLTTR
jgi:hypothetical protein